MRAMAVGDLQRPLGEVNDTICCLPGRSDMCRGSAIAVAHRGSTNVVSD
jgi:hypothetical protein